MKSVLSAVAGNIRREWVDRYTKYQSKEMKKFFPYNEENQM